MGFQGLLMFVVLPCILLAMTSSRNRLLSEGNEQVTSNPTVRTSKEKDSIDNVEQTLKLLPPSSEASVHKLDLSSGPQYLTNVLGPLVINKDGTTSRITNWGKMSPSERERTLRIIAARNRQRVNRLKDEL